MRAAIGAFAILVVSQLATAQTEPNDQVPKHVVFVDVYRDHFEIGGFRFTSIDELREVIGGRSIGIAIRECGADQKLRELGALIGEGVLPGTPMVQLELETGVKCD